MLAAFAVLAGAFIVGLFIKNLAVERRIYWCGWIVGGVLAALSALFRGWTASLAVFGLVVIAAVGYAYFRTPYLKVGRRIFALSESDKRADRQGPSGPQAMTARDGYVGYISAAKYWWILAALMIPGAAYVHFRGWDWLAIAFTAMMAAMTAGCGFGDATGRRPIVRRQYVQALIVSVLSIPLYGAPPAVYLLAYLIGKRWPAPSGRHDALTQHHRELRDRDHDDNGRTQPAPPRRPPQ